MNVVNQIFEVALSSSGTEVFTSMNCSRKTVIDMAREGADPEIQCYLLDKSKSFAGGAIKKTAPPPGFTPLVLPIRSEPLEYKACGGDILYRNGRSGMLSPTPSTIPDEDDNFPPLNENTSPEKMLNDFSLVNNRGKKSRPRKPVVDSDDRSFAAFKKHLFHESKFKQTFHKKLLGVVGEARDINDLIPATPASKKRVNVLYTTCIRCLIATKGEVVIEMTKIFIKYGFNFNLKGEGENSNKNSLMFVIKGWEKCCWTPEEIIETIRLIICEGKADPHMKDGNQNDALKLALRLKLPHDAIVLICEKAVETNPGNVFTSTNKFNKNAIEVAVDSPEKIRTFLFDMRRKATQLAKEKWMGI